jgi:hypothetical protein
MTPPATSQLPVLQILSEAARLHWRHVLIFLGAAVLYAVPVTVILTPMAGTILQLQAKQTPELMEQFASQSLYAVVVIPLLSAALFWFWVRLTLMGARAGWRNDGIGRSLLAILQIAGLMVAAVVAAAVGILPVSLLLGLMGASAVVEFLTLVTVVFSLAFTFSVLSRRLVETALEIRREATPTPEKPRLEQHMRLAALFAATTFGMFLVQTIVSVILTGIGAPLSASVATGILSTATVTIYASIHAIVYRLRSVPPPAL